jgi:murein DD-endopeptidase MepM/ murein hydrolase activator NlpD
VVGVALLSMTGLAIAPAHADREKDLEDRQDRLGEKVDSAERELDASTRQYARAATALEQAQSRLSDARAELADVRGQAAEARALDEQMRRRLAAAEQRLTRAQEDLDQAGRVVDGKQQKIEDFALRSYVDSDPSLLSLNLVLSGQSPTEVSSSISAAESVVDSQTADLDALDAARIMLSLREDRVEDLRDDVADRRADAAANLARMRELAVQAREQTQVVHRLVDDNRLLRDKAEAARAHDLRVLALAAQQARESATPTTTTNGGTSGGGYLDYPVGGLYVTSPYGMRMHPILHVYKLHDGTDFSAGCGTPIYAAADGTVVDASYNTGYGNRVIMQHGIVNGVSLATSYNHLTTAAAQVGQQVDRGELIGYAGTTGYSTGCHLHFMVYVDGGTVDPMNWL